MNILGFEISRKADLTIDQVIRNLEAIHETASGIVVTPENCEESPTVQAIVNAISMHIAALPIHVQRKVGAGREELPNHPVAALLKKPNDWQTRANYWLDAVSTFVRWGAFYALKGRGVTGPIRRLVPVHPSAVDLKQDDATLEVRARVSTGRPGDSRDYSMSEIHIVRGRARDFVTADSPVYKARDAIALEIAAQRFGAAFFGNGAMPGIVFSYADGFRGHMNEEQRGSFLRQFQDAYGKRGRFRAMLLPNGIKTLDPIKVENDKAQFLETRKLQRNVIAGAFGIPPHLVGDLERSTFANVEQQSRDFVQKVVLPYCRIFEDAMERDLLTPEDRAGGVVIRFNLDGSLRGSFKEQQESLKLMREMGALSVNEWREMVGMNPLPSDGDTYWQQGPSGQTSTPQGDDDNDDDQLPD